MEASALQVSQRRSGSRKALRSPALLRALSDDRLVALSRKGSAGAFEAIFERYHRDLLSFCRHMLGTPHEAEDAVQQVFLSAHPHLTAPGQPLQLKAWLYTIARNRCLTTLRDRREQPSAEDFDLATDGLDAQVERRADLRELLVDLRRLPDDQREALVLAEVGALAHSEIAEVIGVPAAKVRALVFQARHSLLASRSARETSCAQIQEDIANARGVELRRGLLRRHLQDCPACADFSARVKQQRAAMAIVLPVVPSLALKHAVIPAAVGSAGGGLGAGSGLMAGGVKALTFKALVAVAVAGAGTAGTVAVVHELRHSGAGNPSAHAAPAAPSRNSAGVPGAPHAGSAATAGAAHAAHPARVHTAASASSSRQAHAARTAATHQHNAPGSHAPAGAGKPSFKHAPPSFSSAGGRGHGNAGGHGSAGQPRHAGGPGRSGSTHPGRSGSHPVPRVQGRSGTHTSKPAPHSQPTPREHPVVPRSTPHTPHVPVVSVRHTSLLSPKAG